MVEESVREKIGNFKNKLLSNKKLDIRFTSKESNTFHYRIGCLPRQLASQL